MSKIQHLFTSGRWRSESCDPFRLLIEKGTYVICLRTDTSQYKDN